MSNPRGDKQTGGGGETDGAIALFLRDFPTFCVEGGGFSLVRHFLLLCNFR